MDFPVKMKDFFLIFGKMIIFPTFHIYHHLFHLFKQKKKTRDLGQRQVILDILWYKWCIY